MTTPGETPAVVAASFADNSPIMWRMTLEMRMFTCAGDVIISFLSTACSGAFSQRRRYFVDVLVRRHFQQDTMYAWLQIGLVAKQKNGAGRENWACTSSGRYKMRCAPYHLRKRLKSSDDRLHCFATPKQPRTERRPLVQKRPGWPGLQLSGRVHQN